MDWNGQNSNGYQRMTNNQNLFNNVGNYISNGMGNNYTNNVYPMMFINSIDDINNIPIRNNMNGNVYPIMCFVQNDRNAIHLRELESNGNIIIKTYSLNGNDEQKQDILSSIVNRLDMLEQEIKSIKHNKYNNRYNKNNYDKNVENKEE